jgi:hypothetical protein
MQRRKNPKAKEKKHQEKKQMKTETKGKKGALSNQCSIAIDFASNKPGKLFFPLFLQF